MNKLLRKFDELSLPVYSTPIALLVVCLLAYALLIWYLGFYWDDYPLAWIAEKMGSAGLASYFSTNRPIWGLLYQITTPILGSEPWHWQIFALFWRWLAAVALWALLRQAWPRQPQIATYTSLFFCVYPAFGQQYISLVYSHFFIILAAFFASLLLTLLAVRRKGNFWLLTGLALGSSLINLLTMEYFFLLELFRAVLIWAAMRDEEPDSRLRLKKSLVAWAPYLALFLFAVVWRAFFFRFQTQNYQPVFLQLLSTQPVQALLLLAGNIVKSLWYTLISSWALPFALPDPAEVGLRTTLSYAGLVLVSGILLFIFLRLRRENTGERRTAWRIIAAGLLAGLLAGGPFWLIDQLPSSQFPADRFSLPFVLGSGLVLSGILMTLPLHKNLRIGLASLLLCLAIGYQFLNGSLYRQDWETQQRFFWQLSWRIPQLQPGTLLLANSLPVTHYSDNSLSAPLNWMFASQASGVEMAYMLLYPSTRLGSKLPALQQNEPVAVDYLAAAFKGTTSQAVALSYNPPGCLRVLDPALDGDNQMLPELMRKAAVLSTTAPILASAVDDPARLPAQLSGPEPAHGWCYYFEHADLARQQDEWEQVVALGEQAFRTGDYPNDPSERIPFIEAYAHTGDWQSAREQTEAALAITPLMQPVLCRLWERIKVDVFPVDPTGSIMAELNCN